MANKKDITFLYNKITNLEIIVETLYELMVENGMTTQEDFDDRIKVNIELVQKEMNKILKDIDKSPDKSDSNPDESKTEGLNPLYWGKQGEA